MSESVHSITLPYLDELVLHLSELPEVKHRGLARLYGVERPTSHELAELILARPAPVRRAVESRVRGAQGWHFFREMVINHNRAVGVGGASRLQRAPLEELGLVATGVDEQGRQVATMPAGMAMIFAEEAQGHRASMPLLLSMQSEQEVRRLAEVWGIDASGSMGATILELADWYRSDEALEAIIAKLPDEDWLGDALTVLELGGTCFWPQVFGFDAEDHGPQGSNNVVPLMDRGMRRQQQQVAEKLLELGVLIRFELEVDELLPPLVSVPQELWGDFADKGQQWLEGWVHQALAGASHHGSPTSSSLAPGGLNGVAKWLCLEAEAGHLEVDENRLSAESEQHLEQTYGGQRPFDGERIVQWMRHIKVLEADEGQLRVNDGKAAGLDEDKGLFEEALISNWVAGSTGSGADEKLAQAIGLDSDWQHHIRSRRQIFGALMPQWMEVDGVATEATGAGCLRDPGMGPKEVMQYELMMTIKYAARTKLLWLDAMSRLPKGKAIPQIGVVDLLRTSAAYCCFEQIREVLRSHPSQIYLPFQRASVLMDPRHLQAMEAWVEDVFQRLLVPLGVADWDGEQEVVRLNHEALAIDLLPEWVCDDAPRASQAIFEAFDEQHDEGPAAVSLRAVEGGEEAAEGVPVTWALEELRHRLSGRPIASFDGEYLHPES